MTIVPYRSTETFETFSEHLVECLEDPEFREAWEASEPTYQVARAMVINTALDDARYQDDKEFARIIGLTWSDWADCFDIHHYDELLWAIADVDPAGTMPY